MRNKIKSMTLIVAVCVMATTAGTAFAQTGGIDSYRGVGEQVQGNVQAGNPDQADGAVGTTTASGGAGGALPFTGLDVALIVAVGGLLLAVGLGTRRLTRHADAA
jgi:hypothetical protein